MTDIIIFAFIISALYGFLYWRTVKNHRKEMKALAEDANRRLEKLYRYTPLAEGTIVKKEDFWNDQDDCTRL